MASVSADPLKAIAYRTGIQTFTGTAPVPTFRAYEFADVNDFSEAIVRFKDFQVRLQQTVTETSYTADGSSSYESKVATTTVDYTYKFVHTDTSYLAAIGTNEIVPSAPFRQRDNRAQVLFVWEYNNFTTSELQSTLDVGNWTVTTKDSSGSTIDTFNGDVHPSASGKTFTLVPEYSTNKWYLENDDTFTTGFSVTSSGTIPSGVADPSELEIDDASAFESAARIAMPSISGASIIDFFVGVPSGSFPSDTDFPSGAPQFRFTQSTTITPSYTLYSL
jgi:hypothetical protein